MLRSFPPEKTLHLGSSGHSDVSIHYWIFLCGRIHGMERESSITKDKAKYCSCNEAELTNFGEVGFLAQ